MAVADGQVRFDTIGVAEDLSVRSDACAVARTIGTTGMRSCLLNASYPRMWVQFSVDRLHPSRFLHVGLAPALEGPSRRQRACAMPIDRWSGYCFKLSDGCLYGADGSKWSTDYADAWGFDVPVRTVGILTDFPPTQARAPPRLGRRPRGDSASVASSLAFDPATRVLSAAPSRPGSLGESASADALSTASSGRIAFVTSAPGVPSSGESAHPAIGVDNDDDDAVASLAARLQRRQAPGSGSVMFAINGRVVVRTHLLRDGGRRSAGQRIRSLEEARSRARDASRKLRRTYKVNRNRLRGGRAPPPDGHGLGTIAEEGSQPWELPPGTPPASDAAPPSSRHTPVRGEGRSGHRSPASWVHQSALAPVSEIRPPSAAIATAAAAGAAAEGKAQAEPRGGWPARTADGGVTGAGGGAGRSGIGSPFAFSEVPGWYGSWRIAISLGGFRDAVSLAGASTQQPQVLDDFLGL